MNSPENFYRKKVALPFFGVDFVMRNVQLEVLRIHQRSTTRNLQ